jgi:hypothetical protein
MRSICVTAAAIVVAAGAGPAQAGFQTFFGASTSTGVNIVGRTPYDTARTNFLGVLNSIIATETFETIAPTVALPVGGTVATSVGTLTVTGVVAPGPRVRVYSGFSSFQTSRLGARGFEANAGDDFRIDLPTGVRAGAFGFSMRDFDTVGNARIVLSLRGAPVQSFVINPSGSLPGGNVAFFGVAADDGFLFDRIEIVQDNVGDIIDFDNFIIGTVIPLPTSVALAGAGLVVVGMRRRAAAR